MVSKIFGKNQGYALSRNGSLTKILVRGFLGSGDNKKVLLQIIEDKSTKYARLNLDGEYVAVDKNNEISISVCDNRDRPLSIELEYDIKEIK